MKAAVQVNSELLLLYWNLGKMINEKLSKAKWGSAVLEELSKDLMSKFSEMKVLIRNRVYAQHNSGKRKSNRRVVKEGNE
ncbi:MAG TPA: DUF1016 N-terminal domain-containing protein [Bacteroidia bacterium]|nr:DUF1016 N-terminal domain-containing protein [Bacteroidia bacterium]